MLEEDLFVGAVWLVWIFAYLFFIERHLDKQERESEARMRSSRVGRIALEARSYDPWHARSRTAGTVQLAGAARGHRKKGIGENANRA